MENGLNIYSSDYMHVSPMSPDVPNRLKGSGHIERDVYGFLIFMKSNTHPKQVVRRRKIAIVKYGIFMLQEQMLVLCRYQERKK